MITLDKSKQEIALIKDLVEKYPDLMRALIDEQDIRAKINSLVHNLPALRKLFAEHDAQQYKKVVQ